MNFRNSQESILIIGRGDPPVSSHYILNIDEIQCCKAIIEEAKHAVLMTTFDTPKGMSSILNISSYTVSFSYEAIDTILEKENIDIVFAPFTDSKGWKMVQELDESGYWAQRNINVIKANLPVGFEQNRYLKFRAAISQTSLMQARYAELSSACDARAVLNDLGGLPVTLHSEKLGRTRIIQLGNYDKEVQKHFKESGCEKLFVETSPMGGKEVTIGVLKDQEGATAVVFSSENVMPLYNSSNELVIISPVQTLNRDDRQFLYQSALNIVQKFDEFSGFCSITFTLDSSVDSILVSSVSFYAKRPAIVSLSLGTSLYRILTKLAMGQGIKDLGFDRELKPDYSDLILLSVPYQQNEQISSKGFTEKGKLIREKIYAGHNFCEILQKIWGEGVSKHGHRNTLKADQLVATKKLFQNPYWDQFHHLYQAFKIGVSVDELLKATNIESWFLNYIKIIVDLEQQLQQESLSTITYRQWENFKICGFSDRKIAGILSLKNPRVQQKDVLKKRREHEVEASFTIVDFRSFREAADHKENIMVLTSGYRGARKSHSPIPPLLLVNEARRMGYNIVLVTADTQACLLWMSFADCIYMEPLKWDKIYEIYLREDPSGIFIDLKDTDQKILRTQFQKIKAPVVKIPELFFLDNKRGRSNR